MKDILSKEQYEPPEVDVLSISVERGFFGSGGSNTDDPVDDSGGTTVPGMPIEPF